MEVGVTLMVSVVVVVCFDVLCRVISIVIVIGMDVESLVMLEALAVVLFLKSAVLEMVAVVVFIKVLLGVVVAFRVVVVMVVEEG